MEDPSKYFGNHSCSITTLHWVLIRPSSLKRLKIISHYIFETFHNNGSNNNEILLIDASINGKGRDIYGSFLSVKFLIETASDQP